MALICLLTPPLIVAGGYGLWRWTAAARLNALIAAVEEQGEPTTIEELEALFPSTPEAERATELWRSAVEAATPSDPNRARELESFLSELDGRFPSYEMLTLGARAIFDEEGLLSEVYRPRAETYRAEIAAAVERAEQAERVGGTTRFLIEGDRISDTVEHWHRFIALYEALRLEIELRRADGDAEGVARGIETLLALGKSLENEPDPRAQAVRWRAVFESIRPLKASLIRDDFSDEALETLQRTYEAISFDAAIHPVLLTYQLVEVRRSQGLEPLNEQYRRARFCPEEVTALSLGLLREMIDAAENPQGVMEAHGALEERMQEHAWGPDSNYATRWITGMRYAEASERLFYPVASALGMRNGEQYAALAATAIACVRYRRTKGELPATLEALVPEYLASVPHDANAEPHAPAKFLVTETGFVVYGVGYNHEDDGAGRRNEVELDDVIRIEKAEFAPPPLVDESLLPPLDVEEIPFDASAPAEPPVEERTVEALDDSGALEERP